MANDDRKGTPHGRPSPTISVVIPAFEAAAYVGDAIRSVLAQDVAADEVIVVDDGSSDGTADVVRSFGPAVSLISKPNGGEASARNAGLRAARSEWVAYLDADDRFLPGRLRRMRDAIRHDGTLDVVTADGFVEAAGEIIDRCYGPQWSFPADGHRDEILRRNFVLGHVIVRRQLLLDLGGFNEGISHTTDWEMWIRVLYDGGRIGFVEEPLSIYRVHTSSLSADRTAMGRGALATLASAERLDLRPAERAVLGDSIAHHRALLARDDLHRLLLAGTKQVRAEAAAVVRDGAQPLRSRLKAAGALAAPRVLSAVFRHRHGGNEVATMGRFMPPAPEPTGNPHTGRSSVASTGVDVPLVSVVLPFLKDERYLDGAIETVRNQTFGGWELLLVDDGSTDASSTIAHDVVARDARIRVVRRPGGAKAGLPVSRNLGVANARGAALAFLDGDDRWAADKLSRQLDVLAAHPDVGMICGPTWTCRADGSASAVSAVMADAPRLLRRGEFARRLLRGELAPPPSSNVMYRTSALRRAGGIPAGDNLYEDQRTFVAVSLTSPVHVGDEPLSSRVVRPDSLFGSVTDDVDTRWQQQRFRRWVIDRARNEGPHGWRLIATMAEHRVRVAVRKRSSMVREGLRLRRA